MRPLRLEIEGFATFRDRVEVDFTDIDVVALVGPTGAGKSTIIDAITFALYGSVARYDDRGAVAPVINQLSAEAKVRLDFQAGGNQYTAVRVVRRTKTGATTKEARLECNGQVLAGDARGVDTAVKELLGLDFERFNKTVVLPQGKFATFLHDKPADRQQLLRELLGMGIYERLGRVARQQAVVADNQLSILEPQLIAGEDLSPAQLDALRDRHERAGLARRLLADATAEMDDLVAEHSAMSQQLTDLGSRLQALSAVSVPDGIDLLANELADSQELLAATDASLIAARNKRKTCDQLASQGPSVERCETLIQQYELAEELAQKLRDLGASRAEAAVEHAEVVISATAIRAHLGLCRTAVFEARSRSESAAGVLADMPDIPQLEACIADHHRRTQLAATLAAADSDTDAATEALATTQHMAEVAETQYRELVIQAPAAALAATIVVGEPCPVCSQLVHVHPGIHDNNHALNLAEQAATSTRNLVQPALAAHARAVATLRSIADDLTRVELRLAVSTPLDDAQKMLEIVTVGRDDLAAAQSLVATAEAKLRAVENDPHTESILASEAQLASLVGQFDAAIAAYSEQQSRAATLLSTAPCLATLIADLACAHQLADDRQLAAQAEVAAEIAATRAIRDNHDALQREATARHDYTRSRDHLAVLSPPAPKGDLRSDWIALSAWATDTERTFKEQTERTSDRRAELAQQIESMTTAMAALCAEFVVDRSPQPSQLREQMASAQARVESEIERFDERRRQFDVLVAQADTVRDRRQVATMLGNLLRSDGFEKWLLQEVLVDLVARATVRLTELSGGQFSLVSSDGAFQICDHRNADEVRDARTLSGGETFLASLALALALADASADLAAEGSAPLESIFLDEGFGTLDPDTLDVVASTLEELGASGRMVGVVTHIRELAERMPIRLEVSKGPTTSTVQRVDG